MKKYLSLGLAGLMAASAFLPAYAADVTASGSNGTAPLTISADAAGLDVSVPLALTAHVSSVGKVTTASDAQIINKSSSQVKVSAVSFEAQGDWALAAYGADLSEVIVGTKTVGIKIAGAVDSYENINLDNGIYTDADGAANGDVSAAFSVIPGAVYDDDGNTEGVAMTLKYDATIPVQKDSIAQGAPETAANVIFTISWDEATEG